MAKRIGSSDAPRCLRAWEENFACAIVGAQTVEALQELKTLLPAVEPLSTMIETRRLSVRLDEKLKKFEKAARTRTVRIPDIQRAEAQSATA